MADSTAAFDEGIEFFALFGSHDEHLAGETVAESVVLYAFFGLRRGRPLFGFEGARLAVEIVDKGRHFEDRPADVLSVALYVFRVWILHFRAPFISVAAGGVRASIQVP